MIQGTRRRMPESASVASSTQTARERMSQHAGLMAARAKLNELEFGQMEVRSRIEQQKAGRNADVIAQKLLNNEPIESVEAINIVDEQAKLKGYETAIVLQKRDVEIQMRAASREVCDLEADVHFQRATELVEAGKQLMSTFDAMEEHVTSLRRAGVQLDNRFPLFDGARLRQLIFQLKPILGLFEEFAG